MVGNKWRRSKRQQGKHELKKTAKPKRLKNGNSRFFILKRGIALLKFDFSTQEWQELYRKCSFTDEELKIIQYRRRGWSLSTIAAELYLSERTINRRISSITKKIIKSI